MKDIEHIKKNHLQFLRVQLACAELRYKKYIDYGDSYKTMGVQGIAFRINDKIQRILNVYRSEHAAVDESVRDTLIDISNYCIMAVMMLDDELSIIKKHVDKDLMLPDHDELIIENIRFIR